MKSNACLRCRRLDGVARNGNGQRGVALILALLIMATVAAMAVYLQADFDRTIRFAGNRLHSQQGLQVLLGGEALARHGLAQDLKDNQVDHTGEFWAQPQVGSFDAGGIALQLEDLQGRLNINNLQGAVAGNNQAGATAQQYTPSQRRFIRLLQTFEEPGLSESEAVEITQAVIDWLDADDDTSGFGGAEFNYYQSAGDEFGVPGYRPANREMKSVSELRLVKGVTPELYKLLQPYVCALPVGVELNINTASGRVLRTLNISNQLAPLSQQDGNQLEQARGDSGFADITAFFDTDIMADLQARAQRQNQSLNDQLLSVSSGYFMLHTEALVDQRRSYATSVLHRTDDNGVRVIGRQLGK